MSLRVAIAAEKDLLLIHQWSSPFHIVAWFDVSFSDDGFFNLAARNVWCVVPDDFVECVIFTNIMAHLADRNINEQTTYDQDVDLGWFVQALRGFEV